MKHRLKQAWFSVFRDHPRAYVGRLLIALLPRRVLARFHEAFFSNQQSEGQIARTVRAGVNRAYYSQDEREQRRLNRERFWGGAAGAAWHEKQRQQHGGDAPSDEFLRYRRPFVEQLKALLAADGRFATLCEIGTGNGLFLQYLSRELPQVQRFVGIDLNREQVARNREVFAGSALEFVGGEVDEWLASGIAGPTIFVAAGTLECFTQAELLDLLTKIQALRVPAAMALCEPVNIDLHSVTASAPRGNTMYSHNYPHLLRSAGYTLFRQHVEPIDEAVPFYQMVVMIATTAPVGRGEGAPA